MHNILSQILFLKCKLTWIKFVEKVIHIFSVRAAQWSWDKDGRSCIQFLSKTVHLVHCWSDLTLYFRFLHNILTLMIVSQRTDIFFLSWKALHLSFIIVQLNVIIFFTLWISLPLQLGILLTKIFPTAFCRKCNWK